MPRSQAHERGSRDNFRISVLQKLKELTIEWYYRTEQGLSKSWGSKATPIAPSSPAARIRSIGHRRSFVLRLESLQSTMQIKV